MPNNKTHQSIIRLKTKIKINRGKNEDFLEVYIYKKYFNILVGAVDIVHSIDLLKIYTLIKH